MEQSLVIGCAVHNNLKYTKLFLESIKCSYPYEILIVDNGSTDGTTDWLKESKHNCIFYNKNMGFGCAYNDALDYAFKNSDKLLLWCGNDIVFRPESVNHMVQALLSTDYEMFCGNEILNKEILSTESGRRSMDNFKYKFSFDESKSVDLSYSYGGMNHSCIIRKKSVFEKVGYYDVHFYPAYFEDNDYAKRCDLAHIKYGTVESAIFYHFWSRTIHEGGMKEINDRRFDANRQYYFAKWGGYVGQEKYVKPFNYLANELSIFSRADEAQILGRFGI